jgi:hypothetical protein
MYGLALSPTFSLLSLAQFMSLRLHSLRETLSWVLL